MASYTRQQRVQFDELFYENGRKVNNVFRKISSFRETNSSTIFTFTTGKYLMCIIVIGLYFMEILLIKRYFIRFCHMTTCFLA